MRIVIDYRPALRARTGVGEHIHQVARHLANTEGDELTLFSSSWKDRLSPELASDVRGARTVDRRFPVSALNLAWHRLRWPPIETVAGGDFDIAHSPHPLLLPSRRAAQLVTIHDLYFLQHPDRTSAEIRRDYASLAGEHARRADRIIVVSKFMSGEVERAFQVPPERISICRNGAPEWRDPPAQDNPNGYILFLGTIEPRKNIGALIDAYGRVRARQPAAPRLIIAGGGPDADRLLAPARVAPLAAHIEHRGYIPPGEREALYKGAQMFVLPSFDEGFGIPALEAMASGVPVIASNRGALPEVAGDAALLIDPDDPESLASAMLTLLNDQALRAAHARRGLERARTFTWAQTARDVRQAYELAKLHRDAHRH